MSVDNTTLNLNGATVQPATYTKAAIDYTLKITGKNCKVTNGIILSPMFVGADHLFANGVANLKKAIIWIADHGAWIDKVTFTNIP